MPVRVWPQYGKPLGTEAAPCIDNYGLYVRSSRSSGRHVAAEPPRQPEAASPAASTAARRVQEITDVVLQNHIDPPARQQMVLSGIKALARGGRPAGPRRDWAGASRR